MPHEAPISLWGQLPARGANSNPGNGTAREGSAAAPPLGAATLHTRPPSCRSSCRAQSGRGAWRAGLQRAGVTPRPCLCCHPQPRPHPVDPALPRAQDGASKADMESTRTSQWVPATCPHLDPSSGSHLHSCPHPRPETQPENQISPLPCVPGYQEQDSESLLPQGLPGSPSPTPCCVGMETGRGAWDDGS